MTGGQLRHHINEGDVEEYAGGGSKHPGGEVVKVAQGKACQHAHEGQDGGEDVVEDRLLDCHAGFQKHCKVSWFGYIGEHGDFENDKDDVDVEYDNDEGQDGGEHVVEDRLLDCHTGFQKHCKVSWFDQTGQHMGWL